MGKWEEFERGGGGNVRKMYTYLALVLFQYADICSNHLGRTQHLNLWKQESLHWFNGMETFNRGLKEYYISL